MTPSEPIGTFTVVPDPGAARTLNELVERLRSLKVWAGDPPYDAITDRVNAAWAAAGRPANELARRGTVVDCFKRGRRRLNADLVIAVVSALHPDEGYVAQWRQALRVVGGETRAAAQVRAQDALPTDLAEFTGRGAELDRLRAALHAGRVGDAVVISAIEGMAGVGKTQLAVHAGHLLAAERPFEQVLFVNLRGFHTDPAQPPADPAAVLESFLRLLGVPGQQIPHELAARTALYRRRLAGRRALVVLDNAADEDQVRPLLPESRDCVTLVSSRRRLAGLHPATHLTVDVFSPDEAVEFLQRVAPDVPVGPDAGAWARVAHRCGYLPLALGLVAGQMCARPGWTVTDHADRLDERHHTGRLESGVDMALSLSYQHLPAPRRRLLRLLGLHPGGDFDRYAAAALADIDPDAADGQLRSLCVDHLLRPAGTDRYLLHDLVRAYAADRTGDEDRPAERRAALTRLFDHYLSTAATAMDIMNPAGKDDRPRIQPLPVRTPPLGDAAAARAWLDGERANLIAAAIHAAGNGWPRHTTRLATTLYRYLDTGGRVSDAITLHTHARDAARQTGDRAAEAQALTDLGSARLRLGATREAGDLYRQALGRYREIGDRFGQARVLGNLGLIHKHLGEYQQAADYHQETLTLYLEIGDRYGEARTLGNLGLVYARLGRDRPATDMYEQAHRLFREVGDRLGEALTLTNLGNVHGRQGRSRQASDCHERALALFRETGHRAGEAGAQINLGAVCAGLGEYRRAADHHQRALTLFREIGDPEGEAEACNSLGEVLLADGQYDQARSHHTTALGLAEQMGERHQKARAHNGVARTLRACGDVMAARQQWQLALAIFTDIGAPEAEQVRVDLATLH